MTILIAGTDVSPTLSVESLIPTFVLEASDLSRCPNVGTDRITLISDDGATMWHLGGCRRVFHFVNREVDGGGDIALWRFETNDSADKRALIIFND